MTLTLLTAYNAPYLAALTFVLLTGIAETYRPALRTLPLFSYGYT